MQRWPLISGLVLFVGSIAWQASLPTALIRHFETLANAPSLTVDYTVRTIGETAQKFKLQFSKPGVFKLTTPTGYVNSDGKLVTTYKVSDKTYFQEAYTPAWVAQFIRKPEILAWGAYLEKDPATSITGAKAGPARVVQGNETDEVEIALKKIPTAITLFVDKKIGIARGYSQTVEGKQILVTASMIEVGTDAISADQFAFVPPEGSKKVEPEAQTVDFKSVLALMTDRCMPCHSATERKDGVDLSNYNGVLATVTPGDPASSRLIKSVRTTGRDRMPKNNPPLSEAQIKLLEAWVKAGAKPN